MLFHGFPKRQGGSDARSQSPSKKSKKEEKEVVVNEEDLSPLAHPLAQKKLVKKLHKTIKKGAHTSLKQRLVGRSCSNQLPRHDR